MSDILQYRGTTSGSNVTGITEVSSTNPLPVTVTSGTTDQEVVGNVASGATDSGNPVKTGGVYNSSNPTFTNGQRGDTQIDAAGNTKTTMGTSLSSTTDSVGTNEIAPQTSTTGSYTSSFTSSALEASRVVKNAACKVYKGNVRVDSTLASGTYYIQLLNASSLPADGAVTFAWNPIKVIHTVGTSDYFDFDFGKNGLPCSTGFVTCLSTTEFTKTISSAVLSQGWLTN